MPENAHGVRHCYQRAQHLSALHDSHPPAPQQRDKQQRASASSAPLPHGHRSQRLADVFDNAQVKRVVRNHDMTTTRRRGGYTKVGGRELQRLCGCAAEDVCEWSWTRGVGVGSGQCGVGRRSQRPQGVGRNLKKTSKGLFSAFFCVCVTV